MKQNSFAHPTSRPNNTWRKTLTYYALHIAIAAGISFAITGSWPIALAVSLLEPAVQVLAWLSQPVTLSRQPRQPRQPRAYHCMQSCSKTRYVRRPQRHWVQRYLAHYAQVA